MPIELDARPDDSRMIKGLMDRGLKLPPQPKVVKDLLMCKQRQERDVRVLARIICADAGITSFLFRTVQSPIFREHQPFSSVEKILQAVGIEQVINLVQALAIATAGMTQSKRDAYQQFWANSMAIARMAMLVAEDRVTVCNVYPDQAYLAGVFHDCGVPLLMERFPSYCNSMDLNKQLLWSNLGGEDGKYQTNHAVVGFFVAKHWKLPDFVCDSVRFHHDLRQLDDHKARSLVAILQMAFHLYCGSLRRENPEWADNGAFVLDELGLHPDSLGEFSDEMIDRFNTE